MLYFSPIKIWGMLGVILLGIFLALPNVLPSSLREKIPFFNAPVVLGLDLRGGSHVLLEVDRSDLEAQAVAQLLGDIRQLLREKRIRYSGLTPRKDGVFFRLITPSDGAVVSQELERMAKIAQGGLGGVLLGEGVSRKAFEIQKNSAGEGTFLVYLAPEEISERISRAIEQSLEIVERRLNALGTTEPIIQKQGEDRILVQLPGLGDPGHIKQLLGKTARLTFQLLCATQPSPQRLRPPFECEEVSAQKDPNAKYWVQNSSKAKIDGADLKSAWSDFDSQSAQYVVQFSFNQKGALKFGKLTKENVGQPFAIVLDKEMISSPVIEEPILGGGGRISGRFTQQEASDLAIVLRSGALPAKLAIIEERTVGPSLGTDSIKAGVLACTVGLLGILLFMTVFYGLFGLFAIVALLVNLTLMIGLLSLLGATLTLPGIAGIVLTMGVAVDANVLIYERIREEMKLGRSVLSSLETGFKMAFGTIFDANATTLIAVIVLFGLGSGPVRGFAVTLALGVVTTVFTAFTLTRLLVALWVRFAKPKTIPL